jgi:hypothetical protein
LSEGQCFKFLLNRLGGKPFVEAFHKRIQSAKGATARRQTA